MSLKQYQEKQYLNYLLTYHLSYNLNNLFISKFESASYSIFNSLNHISLNLSQQK